MPAQPINIRTCDSDAIANGVAATFARAYGSVLIVTTVLAEGSRPRHNVCVARRDGRRITNDTLQAYIAFASGAAAAIDFMATARQGEQRGETPAGCEFCNPVNGDPFTNRPRGEAWTCPYCNTQFTGKETS